MFTAPLPVDMFHFIVRVPGLDEGVSQLSIGERAKIVIPPQFAYKEKGFPGLIPPDSTLIFDVELITFN